MIFFLLISEVWEINFLMFFEARALIFESQGPFGRFLEPLSDFFEESEFTDPHRDVCMSIRFGVRGGYGFAELPNWEWVFLKSGTDSEAPECLIRSVSSPQHDSGNSQPKS